MKSPLRVSTALLCCLCCLSTGLAPAQAGLRLETEPPAFADFVAAAAAALEACHQKGTGPVDARGQALPPRQATGPLLAWLWLCADERARDILRAECAAPERDAETAAWIALHHYWYLRATRDAATVRAHAGALAACAAQLTAAATAGEIRGLAADALRVHAVACSGGLLDSLDRIAAPQAWADGPRRPAPGASLARQALEQLTQFEQRYWCEESGRFAAEAPATSLWPCWIGMLATSGDRTRRNGTAALRGLAAADLEAEATAMAVVAAAQFEQGASTWLQALLRQNAPSSAGAPSSSEEQLALGAAVDAALFAVTGVRMATGPGVDEDWLRLRPMLPPGGVRIAVRGVRHDGWCADLWLDRRSGTPTAHDRELLQRGGAGAALEPDDPVQWMQGAVAVQGDATSSRCVVVHGPGQQFVARLRSGGALEFAWRDASGSSARAPSDR